MLAFLKSSPSLRQSLCLHGLSYSCVLNGTIQKNVLALYFVQFNAYLSLVTNRIPVRKGHHSGYGRFWFLITGIEAQKPRASSIPGTYLPAQVHTCLRSYSVKTVRLLPHLSKSEIYLVILPPTEEGHILLHSIPGTVLPTPACGPVLYLWHKNALSTSLLSRYLGLWRHFLSTDHTSRLEDY